MNEMSRLCSIVHGWHEWYKTPDGSPPTPTEDVIAMVHDLGYGREFRDVKAIHAFVQGVDYCRWWSLIQIATKARSRVWCKDISCEACGSFREIAELAEAWL